MKTGIGFTGTREGMTRFQQRACEGLLEWLFLTLAREGHHGDCVGADADFHRILIRMNARIILHPPEKKQLRANCSGYSHMHPEKNYLSRNRDIVDCTRLLIGCPKEPHNPGKGGTWYTIGYAGKQQLPLIVVQPNGCLRSKNLNKLNLNLEDWKNV